MVGREASFRYNKILRRHGVRVAVVGREASFRYNRCSRSTFDDRAVVGREASFRYNDGSLDTALNWLWLVGKRRSDTISIMALHSIPLLWLVGKRRSDTIYFFETDTTSGCGW